MKNMSVDEQAGDIRMDAACGLQELFNVLSRVQSKAQPLAQNLLGVSRLFESPACIPLIQKGSVCLFEYGFDLTLTFVGG